MKRNLWDIVNKNNTFSIDNKVMNENLLFNMFLSKTLTMFKYKGLPNSIPYEILENYLQTTGKAFIFKYDEDLIALPIDLNTDKVDYYNRPTTGNVFINGENKLITVDLKDGVLISNDYLQLGFTNLFNKYSYLINQSELTLYIANIWKRASKIISASDDSTIQSAKEYVKKIENGDMSVISTNPIFNDLNITTDNVTSVSLSELIQYDNYFKSNLFNEIGLSSNKDMKKERLITSEIEQNNNVIYPFVDNMIDCRKTGISKVNEMFNLNISVEFNSSWNEETEPKEDSQTLDTEPKEDSQTLDITKIFLLGTMKLLFYPLNLV